MQTDVLIIGAGPTGLTLAAELARYGVDFLIIDSKPGITNLSKALGIQARTMELFEDVGIADKAVELGFPAKSARAVINGKLSTQVPISNFGQHLSKYPYMLVLEQFQTEKLLQEKLNELGETVLWDHTVEELTKEENIYKATVKNKLSKHISIKATYVVGCDGASSFVRKASNIDFVGSTHAHYFYVIDTEVEWDLDTDDSIFLAFTDTTFLALFRMKDGNRFRVIGDVPPEQVKKYGTDVPLEILVEDAIKDGGIKNMQLKNIDWHSSYKVHTRMAKSFKKERIFLAGDAAHIHTPAGGQGMNTGIQDAYNLAWKLAFVLNQNIKEKFLSTYETERKSFAKLLLSGTDRAFSYVTNNTLWGRVLRVYIFPFVLKIVGSNPLFQRIFFRTLSQTQVKYSSSRLTVQSKVGKVSAGERLPYFHVKKEQIYDLLRESKFILLIVGNFSLGGFELPSFVIEKHIKEVSNKYFKGEKNFMILVRPDKYISYIGRDVGKVQIFLKELIPF